MQSRKLSLALLALALGACSVDASDPDTAETKQAARDRLQNAASDSDAPSAAGSTDASARTTPGISRPTQPADVCLLHKWYGDGECDVWCPRGDPADCAPPTGGGVICAEFFSPADGYCDPRDPCGPVQDEDCQKGGGTQPCDPMPTPRPEPGDGKCEPTSCEELKVDVDCRELACPAIFSSADGKCEPRSACDFVIDEDCAKPCASSGGGSTPCDGGREPDGCVQPTNPIICPAIRYEDNGKCEAPPACRSNDPIDCAVACIDIAYPTNGKCEAAPGCEANDPRDCAVACDAIRYPDNGKCEAPPGCEANDPGDCGPVACRAILYPDNGVCEASPGCESSDPKDCTGVICLAILYAENGKCEAAPGCEASDPDC
jgi:hypothetical protein